MPKISKTPKVKKIATKKKTSTVKAKETPVKKKTVKKPATKKATKTSSVKKEAPKKTNKVIVDIISDENESFFGYDENNQNEEPINLAPVFSSWPNFDKKNKAEDILSEIDDEEEEEIREEDEDGDDFTEENEEYDKQKKFFSDWASQNAPKEGEEKPSLAPVKKSIGLYRRQAIFYLGATLILLLAVAYFFFVKLTVLISPQGETINDSVSFNVVATDASSTATSTDSAEAVNKTINGNLQITEVDAEKTYQTASEDTSEDESTGLVMGTVTLINKYNKTQPLVAKTRLLSPDGKLFRLKEAVSIPAGGTATASVYADKNGSDMAVDANTRFTIPGLWAGIQDRIYAENSAPLTYQLQEKRIIKQSDLDKAKKDINEVINLKIKNQLQSVTSDKAAVSGDIDDEIVTEFNAKVGDERSDFTVKAKKKVVIATFSKNKVIELAKARLSLVISDDKQLSNFNTNQITYSLENYDQSNKTAEIKAYFTGLMSLKSDSSLIDRKKLVGLNEKQISQYLDTFPEVKEYKLEFWPSFIKTAPNLPDRINIKINE